MRAQVAGSRNRLMSRKPSCHSRRRVASRVISASWRIALIAFHAVLLAGRLSDASILEPAVLARWGGALALVLTASLFHRFAPVRLRGRRAIIVFWLLAAFLHFFGPLEHLGREFDLELTLGFAIPALAFALLLAAASRAASSAGRVLAQLTRLRYLAPALIFTAPRGPPLRGF